MRTIMLLLAVISYLSLGACHSWEVVNSDFASVAMAVDFINDDTGFVPAANSGSLADVLKTTDAGRHWSVCPTGDALAFLAGAAAGKNVAVGGMFSFYYSNDEGASFNASSFEGGDILVTQSIEPCPQNSNFFGLVGGSGVAISRDGGASYKYVNISELRTRPRYGAYPTERVWYITAGEWPEREAGRQSRDKVEFSRKFTLHRQPDGTATTTIHRERSQASTDSRWAAQVVKTTDGGKTWQTVFWSNTTFYFNQISCSSEDSCCAVAEGDSGNYIFCTADGGKSWKEKLHHSGTDESIMAITAVSSKEWWAGGGILSMEQFVGKFYHSVDGAQNWNDTGVHDIYPTDISFPGEYHGFATAMTKESLCAFVEYK